MFAAEENWITSVPGIVMATFIFGGWIFVSIAKTLADAWRKAQISEHAAVLKQSMIEKGMAAHEIERVLNIPVSQDSKSVNELVVKMANHLAMHSVPADSIEQILQAFRSSDPSNQATIAKSVSSMLDNGATSEQVLAIIRGLGHPMAPSSDHFALRN